MADLKISALTASTTPLAGTEVLPIVQSSTTKQVSVANLTAGRAVATAALNATGIVLTTDATDASSTTAASLKTAGGLAVVKKIYVGDNIVPATAAKGINFTANTPTAVTGAAMTSQLFKWYEEGTWTPTDGSGAGLTFSVAFCTYTRIGRVVVLEGYVTYPVTSDTSAVSIAGMPFTPQNSYPPGTVNTNAGLEFVPVANTDTSKINLANNLNVSITNVQMSGKYINFVITYHVA